MSAKIRPQASFKSEELQRLISRDHDKVDESQISRTYSQLAEQLLNSEKLESRQSAKCCGKTLVRKFDNAVDEEEFSIFWWETHRRVYAKMIASWLLWSVLCIEWLPFLWFTPEFNDLLFYFMMPFHFGCASLLIPYIILYSHHRQGKKYATNCMPTCALFHVWFLRIALSIEFSTIISLGIIIDQPIAKRDFSMNGLLELNEDFFSYSHCDTNLTNSTFTSKFYGKMNIPLLISMNFTVMLVLTYMWFNIEHHRLTLFVLTDAIAVLLFEFVWLVFFARDGSIIMHASEVLIYIFTAIAVLIASRSHDILVRKAFIHHAKDLIINSTLKDEKDSLMAAKQKASDLKDMNQIMISYKHADTQAATVIATKFKELGFNVWIDEKIRAGKDWRNEIAEAIRNAIAVIFVVSELSVTSKYCKEEIYFARNTGVPIFPLIIR